MKLAFVIKTLDSRGGGAERVLTQVSGELVRRGHQVTLVTFGAPEERDFYPVDPDIRRIWLHAGDVQAPTRPFEFVARVRGLRRVLRELAPDVAIGFMHSAYVPLALAMATTRVPVVASEHTVFRHFLKRPFDLISLFATARLYAFITTISAVTKATFPRALAKRMIVIPNPVAPIESLADPVGGASKIILNVGRLDGPKDQRTLIQAFARLATDYPDWILRIVGQGPLKRELRKLADDLNLGNRVQLAGLSENIEEEYRSAHLFAMPSIYESFGLATAEALSAGLPALGFADCPGTSELIEHGVNGFLVEGSDRVAALAEGLARLMASPELRQRMGAAGPGSVEQYSLNAIGAEWERMLGRMLHWSV